jgi:hypothetical protein
MAETEIPIDEDDELWQELNRSLRGGPIVNDQGQVEIKKIEVGRENGLKMKICADEHPPPHFHVSYQGESASFSITTCERLKGNKGLEKFDRNVRKWWHKNRARLIEVWNENRPTDCTVGQVRA